MVATAGVEVRSPIGLDAHGLAPSGRVYWNPTTSLLYSHALLRGEAQLAEGGPLVVDTGEHTGRSPLDKFIVREPGSEEPLLVGNGQPADRGGPLRGVAREDRLLPRRTGRLRRRRVRRRRSGAPPFAPGRHIQPVARAVRKDALHRPAREGAPPARAGSARAARAGRRGGSRGGRHALRHVRRAPPEPFGGAHRGDVLRGRDQEVDLHGHERPAAAARRDADALLRERRPRRARGRVLRALGDRQDDALRRSRARI